MGLGMRNRVGNHTARRKRCSKGELGHQGVKPLPRPWGWGNTVSREPDDAPSAEKWVTGQRDRGEKMSISTAPSWGPTSDVTSPGHTQNSSPH